MGFSAAETAGYGFVAFLTSTINTPAVWSAPTQLAINAGIHEMNALLLTRMGLAIFGHGVWTGIVCATIWRERGQSAFRLTAGVAAAFAAAVGLHALWDWAPVPAFLSSQTGSSAAAVAGVAIQFGWYAVVGAVGLFLLRFLLRESLRRAKLGPLAPAPQPIFQALVDDTFGRPVDTGSRTALDIPALRNVGVLQETATLATARRPARSADSAH
jgi:hypothetical protein